MSVSNKETNTPDPIFSGNTEKPAVLLEPALPVLYPKKASTHNIGPPATAFSLTLTLSCLVCPTYDNWFSLFRHLRNQNEWFPTNWANNEANRATDTHAKPHTTKRQTQLPPILFLCFGFGTEIKSSMPLLWWKHYFTVHSALIMCDNIIIWFSPRFIFCFQFSFYSTTLFFVSFRIFERVARMYRTPRMLWMHWMWFIRILFIYKNK